MKNLFGQEKKKKKDARKRIEEPVDSIAVLEKKTAEVEAEKARKKFVREERRFLKEQALKRKKLERWLAPILLLITIAISVLIWLLH